MPKINYMRLIGVILAATLAAVVYLSFVGRETEDIQSSVLRLHIVANSDSGADQALKLKVRDEIIERCGFLFRDCRTLEESERAANNNLGFIKYVARDVIRSEGYDYDVSCGVERRAFPTKRYERTFGAVSLPRGEYSALNVGIGEAAGANWWCVMYPPLCFVDGVTAAEADQKLRESLTDSEYELITGSTPEIKIKFKIAELLGK